MFPRFFTCLCFTEFQCSRLYMICYLFLAFFQMFEFIWCSSQCFDIFMWNCCNWTIVNFETWTMWAEMVGAHGTWIIAKLECQESVSMWNALKCAEIHWNTAKCIEIRWNNINNVKYAEIYRNASKCAEMRWNAPKNVNMHCNTQKYVEMRRNTRK